MYKNLIHAPFPNAIWQGNNSLEVRKACQIVRLTCFLQEEGLQAFLAYLRDLISKRAEEDYSVLVEGEAIHPCHSVQELLLSFYSNPCSLPAVN